MARENATVLLNRIKSTENQEKISILLDYFMNNYHNMIASDFALIELILDKTLDENNLKKIEEIVIKSNKIECVYYFVRKNYNKNINLFKLFDIACNSKSILYIYKLYYLSVNFLEQDFFTNRILTKLNDLIKNNNDIDAQFFKEIIQDEKEIKENYEFVKEVAAKKYKHLYNNFKLIDENNEEEDNINYNNSNILNAAVCQYQALSDSEKIKVLKHIRCVRKNLN